MSLPPSLRLALAFLSAAPAAPVLAQWALPGDSPSAQRQEAPPAAIRIAEPAADEIVLIVNNNAAFGNHAGIFAGSRLSDPAGSYVHFRQNESGWRPGLADYVRFQSSDGMHIRSYRFRVAPAVLAAILARLPEADGAKPLFCATAVQNSVAGVGPFAGIPEAGWTTPARLAALLDQLLATPGAPGICQLPDGTPCPATGEEPLQTRLDPTAAPSPQ